MQSPEPSTDHADNHAHVGSSPASAWVCQHYTRITAGSGGLLLFLAALTPVIAPVEQRGTVAIITVLFGFTGALLLYLAVSSNKAQGMESAKGARGAVSARAQLAGRVARHTRLRAVIGLGFGLLQALAALIAPFALSASDANADARFLMVLGFAPVALSGGLIGFVFWRNLQVRQPKPNSAGEAHSVPNAKSADSMTASFMNVAIVSGGLLVLCAALLVALSIQSQRADMAATTAGIGGAGLVLILAGAVMSRRNHTTSAQGTLTVRRAPLARVPRNMLYRWVVPVTIAIMLIVMVVVIGVVLVATLTPLIK